MVPSATVDRQTFEVIRQERVEELMRVRAAGTKLVGYFCIFAPVELIAAAGAIPVRLARGGQAERQAGEKYLRSDACVFCSACAGRFETDPLYRQMDAVVAVNTCDMMRRLPEVIEHHFGIPAYRLYMPRTSEPLPHRVAEFRRQLELLADQLGALTGKRPEAAGLSEATASYNRLRGLLRQADETRRVDNPLLSESALLDLAATAWLVGPVPAESLIDSVLRIVWARPRPDAKRPRLMLGGSMLAEDDLWLLDLVESKADIVTDILCTGTRWFSDDVGPGEPMAALAQHYFGRACMHRRPNDALYEYARRRAASFRVQGMIYKTLLYCDAWNFEARRLQEALGLPMLHLDTDYAHENREQVRTRVEAFLEMI